MGEPPKFDAHIIQNGNAAGLRLVGDLDFYAAPQFRETFNDVLRSGHCQVVVDMGGVEFIDSAGIGVLVSALKDARTLNGNVTLKALRPQARTAFEMTGLTKVFTIEE